MSSFDMFCEQLKNGVNSTPIFACIDEEVRADICKAIIRLFKKYDIPIGDGVLYTFWYKIFPSLPTPTGFLGDEYIIPFDYRTIRDISVTIRRNIPEIYIELRLAYNSPLAVGSDSSAYREIKEDK